MTPQEKLIATAEAEIGYREKASNAQLDDKTANAGSGNWTKYARDLDALGDVYNYAKNGYAWCDIFVDWCFVKTFGEDIGLQMIYQPRKGLGAGCTYSAQYYKAANKFFSDPKIGDQIFFKDSSGGYGHTGIVVLVTDTNVYTVEGNTSGTNGVVAESNAVCRKGYSKKNERIGGYGRPDWALAEDDKMNIEDFISQLTPEQAYSIIQKAQTYARSLPCPAYFESEIDDAMDEGITDGSAPQAFATRAQAAVMALRAVKRAKKE